MKKEERKLRLFVGVNKRDLISTEQEVREVFRWDRDGGKKKLKVRQEDQMLFVIKHCEKALSLRKTMLGY